MPIGPSPRPLPTSGGLNRPTALLQPLHPCPPSWVYRLLTGSDLAARPGAIESRAPSTIVGGSFALLARRVDSVPELSTASFIAAVEEAFRSIARELNRLGRHVLRVWNFIPDILYPVDGVGDRYGAFNAGRLGGYSEWFRPAQTLSAALPTSTAVGIGGDTLWIYAFAGEFPGTPIENPRQTPSYRYSARHGVNPPCFARATCFNSLLLIGGTASILGEDTCHIGDIEAQTRETLRNISSLIVASTTTDGGGTLGALRDVRVYVTDAEHASAAAAVLRETLPNLPHCEFVQAQLCRRDLLVEIEGTALCS